MKKFICILFGAALFALPAIAVTNVATALTSESLPADAFRPVINKAVYDTVNTDVPALVAAVNAAVVASAPVITKAATVAATNAASAGLVIQVNGTNYVLQLYPN